MLKKHAAIIVVLVAVCFVFSALVIADEKADQCAKLKASMDKAKDAFDKAEKTYKDKCKKSTPLCKPIKSAMEKAKKAYEDAQKAYKDAGCE